MSNSSIVSIQFPSIRNLWAFRKELQLNSFYLNISKITITFELPTEEIGWAVERHCGQFVNKKENA